MKLDALMWPDIYTYSYSVQAFKIYKTLFRGEKDYAVSINESNMVVVRSLFKNNFLNYDDSEIMFDKWKSSKYLRNERKFVLKKLSSFSELLKWWKENSDQLLNSINFSSDDIDYLYYLIENQGRISERAVEKREEDRLRELLGNQGDFLTASCLRVFRDSWRDLARVFFKKLGIEHSLIEKSHRYGRDKIEYEMLVKATEKLKADHIDEFLKLGESMGYSRDEIEKELDFEIENGMYPFLNIWIFYKFPTNF